MTRIEGLRCMLDLAEKGEWHFNISAQVFPPESAYSRCTFMDADEAFNGSLDAAKALHGAVLPGWTVFGIDQDSTRKWYVTLSNLRGRVEHTGHPTIPARAWLCAILKALIQEEEAA